MTETNSTPGTEVDKRAFSAENAPPAVLNILRRLNLNASLDSSTAQFEIMAAIQEAGSVSLEAIFAAANAGTLSGEDFVRRPFLLKSDGFEWKRSARQFLNDGGFPFFALMRVVEISTGESHVVACGGYSFVSTLDALDTNGYLAPYDAQGGMPLQIIAKTMKGSGYDVLLLAPAPGPVGMATAHTANPA